MSLRLTSFFDHCDHKHNDRHLIVYIDHYFHPTDYHQIQVISGLVLLHN
jgi:hypothetical protein